MNILYTPIKALIQIYYKYFFYLSPSSFWANGMWGLCCCCLNPCAVYCINASQFQIHVSLPCFVILYLAPANISARWGFVRIRDWRNTSKRKEKKNNNLSLGPAHPTHTFWEFSWLLEKLFVRISSGHNESSSRFVSYSMGYS